MPQVKQAGRAQAQAVPPTVLSEKLSTYAFGTVVAGAVMVAAAAWMGGSLASIDERIQTGFDRIAGAAGFTVTDISVYGLGPRAKADVLNAIGLKTGENMFRADPYLIKARIDDLDSISQVSVRRQWPNEVWVLADPRTPLALWQHEGRWRVVDQFGVAFESEDPQAHAELPRVVGAQGDRAAPGLIEILRDYPEFAEKVDMAMRVGGRRWDLRLHSGLEIAMPEDAGFVEALDQVLRLHDSTGVLSGGARRLDVRDPVHFAILPEANVALRSKEAAFTEEEGA